MAEQIGRLEKIDNFSLPNSVILYVNNRMFYKERDEIDINKIEEYIGKKVRLEYEFEKIFDNLPLVTYNKITNIERLR